ALHERADHLLSPAVNRESQDRESLGLEATVKTLHRGHFLSARRAPGGPEVQDDHLALEVAQPDEGCAEAGHREVGGHGLTLRAEELQRLERILRPSLTPAA